VTPPSTAPAEERKAYNDEQQRRQQAFAAAAKDFGRVLIIVSTIVGVAAILIGAYFPIHAIGTGLIVGGIFAVGWGYWTYWPYLDDWIRFVSLLIAFAILLFVGYRRLGLSRTGSHL
jgi:uncharacterized membrane protein YphA (DoxX/SURF4 family)